MDDEVFVLVLVAAVACVAVVGVVNRVRQRTKGHLPPDEIWRAHFSAHSLYSWRRIAFRRRDASAEDE